jgi:ribonuclease inhibitor
MKTARIDGATIGSVAELHEALRRGLDLPAHTAPNLDALWDTLTRDLPGPAAVEISGVPALRRRLGAGARRVLELLAEVAAERSDFAVTLRD